MDQEPVDKWRKGVTGRVINHTVGAAALVLLLVITFQVGKMQRDAAKPRPPTMKERVAELEIRVADIADMLDVTTTNSLRRRLVQADNLLYNRILVLEKKVKDLESSPVVKVAPPRGE